jgi:hypothetical protein
MGHALARPQAVDGPPPAVLRSPSPRSCGVVAPEVVLVDWHVRWQCISRSTNIYGWLWSRDASRERCWSVPVASVDNACTRTPSARGILPRCGEGSRGARVGRLINRHLPGCEPPVRRASFPWKRAGRKRSARGLFLTNQSTAGSASDFGVAGSAFLDVTRVVLVPNDLRAQIQAEPNRLTIAHWTRTPRPGSNSTGLGVSSSSQCASGFM